VSDDKERNTVALFVDFDHLKCAGEHATAPPLASTLEAVLCRVQELGVVAMANVYANWEEIPGMQAEVKRLHLDPRFVFGTDQGAQMSVARGFSTLVTLALDVQQTMFERDDVDTYVIVSGHAALLDLVGRLRAQRKNVLLIGFERTTHEDLRASAGSFEPLESYVQPDTLPEPRLDTPPSPDSYETSYSSAFDWHPFLLLLNRLEQNLPFVSLKYLKNQVLTPAHGCENTQDSKAALIREAIRLHYIETSKVANPRNPNFATTACRLNRRHPDVRRVLGA
jgi:hypothetical protein